MYKILIADDSATERECVKFLIDKFGAPMECTMAGDGREALEQLRQENYDILFTDIKMPFLDGLCLCAEAQKLYPGIVIVIFSGYSDFDYARSAISLGVTEYLLKPVDPQELQKALARVMEVLEKRRSIETRAAFARRHMLFTLISGEDRQCLTYLPEYTMLMMLSFDGDFFSGEGEHFSNVLHDALPGEYDFISVYPSQGLIFFRDWMDAPETTVETLKKLIAERFESSCECVYARIGASEDLYCAYQNLEAQCEPGREKGDAPGQIPVEELLELLRQNDLDAFREVYQSFRESALAGPVGSAVYTRFGVSRLLCALKGSNQAMESEIVNRVFSARDFREMDEMIQRTMDAAFPKEDIAASLKIEEVKRYVA